MSIERNTENTERMLSELALEARKMAYAPYSGFRVGAALLGASGKVYLGCNIENAAYTPCNCAERTAIFKAVSEGEREFSKIAIVGGYEEGEQVSGYAAPCGVCRQVMMEFCNPETFKVILANGIEAPLEYSLKEMLPLGFGPSNLCK